MVCEERGGFSFITKGTHLKSYHQFIKPEQLKGVLLLVCITDNPHLRRLVHDIALNALVKVEYRFGVSCPFFPVYPESIDEARARGFLETPPEGGETHIVIGTVWPPKTLTLLPTSQPL